MKASRLLRIFSRSRLARSLSVRSCSLKTGGGCSNQPNLEPNHSGLEDYTNSWLTFSWRMSGQLQWGRGYPWWPAPLWCPQRSCFSFLASPSPHLFLLQQFLSFLLQSPFKQQRKSSGEIQTLTESHRSHYSDWLYLGVSLASILLSFLLTFLFAVAFLRILLLFFGGFVCRGLIFPILFLVFLSRLWRYFLLILRIEKKLVVISGPADTLLYAALFVPLQTILKGVKCVEALVPAQVQLHWWPVLKIPLQTRWKLCCQALKINGTLFQLHNVTLQNLNSVGCRRRVSRVWSSLWTSRGRTGCWVLDMANRSIERTFGMTTLKTY